MDLRFENKYGRQIYRTATHLYLWPHAMLRPYVAHYTLCLGNLENASPLIPRPALTLVPDASGCLVFTLREDGTLEGRMYGPTTAVVTVENDLTCCALRFFVEFRPGGLRTFTNIPQWELSDQVYELEDCAPALCRAIEEHWNKASDLDGFVRAVDGLLCRCCVPERAILPLLRQVTDSRGLAPVAELAEETGYSTRHLTRLFREGTGLGVKSFVRVLRINEAAERLRNHPINLAYLAQDLGYFDQAHFAHDFKAVCGVSPSVYLEGLSGFYNEPLKF